MYAVVVVDTWLHWSQANARVSDHNSANVGSNGRLGRLLPGRQQAGEVCWCWCGVCFFAIITSFAFAERAESLYPIHQSR